MGRFDQPPVTRLNDFEDVVNSGVVDGVVKESRCVEGSPKALGSSWTIGSDL